MYEIYTVYLIVTFTGAGMMAALAIHSWTRRATPGAPTFAWLMADFAFTSVCYLLMGFSTTSETIYFWARLRYLGLATIPALFLLFVLEDRGNDVWLRRAPILFVIPLITQVLIWTNDSHRLFFANWSYERTEYGVFENVTYGDGAYLHAIFSFLLISIGLFLLLGRVLNSRGLYRKQAVLLLIGSTFAAAINFLHTLKLLPAHIPNLTPFGFVGMALFSTIALFRYKLFNLVPVAFDTVYKSMRDPVFVFNDQKRVVAINPAAEKLMMQDESQLLGKNAREVFFRYPELLKQYEDVIEARAEIVLELEGLDHTFDLRISPIYQRHKQLAGRLVVLRDVTERKLAEGRDFELSIEREKTRLIASFIRYSSHDLRTPLSKMNMALHIARRTTDVHKREEKLDALEKEILKMTGIIEEMHLLTKLESGLPIDLKTISLDHIVEYVPSDIQRVIDDKNLSLRLSSGEGITICGDAELLRRAFRSILHNAALYTPQSGSISVHTYTQEKWGVIEVVDTGIGIESAKLGVIFDHFAKVNVARTSDGSGAGLGLAIVKKIMDIHHGKVAVMSNPGQGSTFCLMVPLVDGMNPTQYNPSVS